MLTVEDGTGLAGADSYVSLSAFKTWCAERNYRFEDSEDFAIEASLRLATGWLDTKYRYKGTRSRAAQSLEFPRAGLVDWSSFTVTGVPVRVKSACCDLAFKGLSTPLYQDLARGGMIKSESVGPISVTYADGAPAETVYAFADNLLRQYVRDVDQISYSPWSEPASPSAFDVDMHTGGDV